MALNQYDILLPQNVAASGTEWSEKLVHINKGSLLSADTSHVPTVLAVGTDTYVLTADANEATGLKWGAPTTVHTQNTDTGTTGNTFTVDSDSTTGKIVLDVALNAGEDHTMTVTNAVMTADVTLTLPATTGTVALTSQLHTQNTDTGTTGSTFDLDSDGTTNGVKLKTSSGALALRNLADDANANLTVKDLTVSGDITINGTNTIINSTTLTVDDKNIELGSVATPTDTTADGGGITLKGATDKTILWDNANDNWTLNQNVNIPSGMVYKINNVQLNQDNFADGTTNKAFTATEKTKLGAIEGSAVSLATVKADTDVASAISLKHAAVTVSTGGGLVLSGQALSLWSTAPAAYNSDCPALGLMAHDANYNYFSEVIGTAGAGRWSRTAKATNWAA